MRAMRDDIDLNPLQGVPNKLRGMMEQWLLQQHEEGVAESTQRREWPR